MYNHSMRPIKIMRYGSKYSYEKPQWKDIVIRIVVVVCVIAAVVGIVFAVRGFVLHRQKVESDAVQLRLQNGEPILMNVSEGDICMLNMPEGVDLKDVVFSSSDPKIARVDDAGHVDALSEGKATVKAVAPKFAAECLFTVAKAEEKPLSELTTAVKANEDILEQNRASGRSDLYSITVNRRTNTVTVYTYDESGKYTVPVRSMVASCGTAGADATVTGDFSVYFQESWHPLYGNVYGMFVSGFEGPYLLHSIPYATTSHDALDVAEFNKLGENASQGCVRMMVSDVYWIWKNCPLYTPVHVIDADASADPLGRPETIKLPANAKWDPTDNKEANPYHGKLPTLEVPADTQIKKGESFDPLSGATGTDIVGNDISARVRVNGEVLTDKPGTYNLTYTLCDQFGQTVRADRTVTVTE